MTHTTVELENCDVDINSDQINFWVKEPKRELILTLDYNEFDEILAAVARTEEFRP